jgi:hypothetical protein
MWIHTVQNGQLVFDVYSVVCELTFSKPKYLSLPSDRTGFCTSGASSFSSAVGTGALGSFFTGCGAAEALGVCEHATNCQLADFDAEIMVVDAAILQLTSCRTA